MIEFICDWPAVFRPIRHNWIDFTIARLEFEWDRSFGTLAVHAALLGFHVRATATIGYGDTEFQAKLARMMDDIESGEARVSVKLSDLNPIRVESNKPVVEFDRVQGWIDGPTLRAVVEGIKAHPFLGDQPEIRTSRVERIGYGADGEIVEVETRNTIYRVRA